MSWKSPCIWEELPQEHVNKAVANLTVYTAVAASGDHFEHLQ